MPKRPSDFGRSYRIRKIDRFIAPLYVDGKGYIALMTVKEFNNPKDKVGLYTVEELDIKKNPAGLTTVADTDNIDLLAVPLTGFASSIIQKVNSVNQNSHSNLLFQSAYHGSGASFDKFDTAFMGTGEGAQAFGWGVYLTQSEGIARNYAETLYKRVTNRKYYYKGEELKGQDFFTGAKQDKHKRPSDFGRSYR